MDNELDVARNHQSTYKSLVMEGKVMADIEIRPTLSIAPLSIALKHLKTTSDYKAMVHRTVEKHIKGHAIIDTLLLITVSACLAYIVFSLYSLVKNPTSIFDTVINCLLASFFSALIIWGYVQRRYSDRIRYLLFTDPVFFEKAMGTPGAIRLFWIVSTQVAPREYTDKDFSTISGLIQNEYVDFRVGVPSELRTQLKSDSVVVAQFKKASTEGYLFSSVTMDARERDAYDPFSEGNDVEFVQNVMDLFTSNQDFFVYLHNKHQLSFVLTTGSGKSKRTLIYKA